MKRKERSMRSPTPTPTIASPKTVVTSTIASPLKSGTIACPDYEFFWKLGYGPVGGDKIDSDGWKKYVSEMSKEELDRLSQDVEDYLEKNMKVIDPDEMIKTIERVFPLPPMADPAQIERELEQCRESDDPYDGVDYPYDKVVSIAPMFYDMRFAKYDDNLIAASKKALRVYNREEETHYKLKEVVKANYEPATGLIYYITFQAIDPQGRSPFFQAQVYKPWRGPMEVLEVAEKEA